MTDNKKDKQTKMTKTEIKSLSKSLLDEMDKDGTTAASLDDSSTGLKGKSLQVLFYKKANGYSEVAQKVAPAKPFQNIVDNFDENRIARIKEAAERYMNNRKKMANGTSTDSDTKSDEIPWD